MLKRKSLKVDLDFDPEKDQMEVLKQLKSYRFGFRTGAVNTKEFDNATFLKKAGVTNDSQNLLKLFLGRIDFAVIDKYTAAYLMVEKFPHMIGQLEFMEPPLGIRSFHLAFSRNTKGFEKRLADFNRGLKQIVNDKTNGLFRLRDFQRVMICRMSSRRFEASCHITVSCKRFHFMRKAR